MDQILDADKLEVLEETDSFDTIYKKTGRNFARRSKDMSLLDKIIKIESDKEYIFDFIWTEQIQELIQSISNRYKFNRDEAEDIAIFSITEYFYENVIDTEGFKENIFLDKLKDEIGRRTQKMIREGYTAKEIPASNKNIYQYAMYDNSEELINNIDLQNALINLSQRNQEILELRFRERLNESTIAAITGLSQSRISEIITESCEKLKKYL